MKWPLIKPIEPKDRVPELFEHLLSRPYPFLLDSSLLVKGLGRYSIMGSDPFLVMRSRGRQIRLEWGERTEIISGHPLVVLKELLGRYRLAPTACPLPFTGGAAGYFSYDLGRMLERLPVRAEDDLHTPDLCLGFYDRAVVVDVADGDVWLVSTGFPETEPGAVRRRATERLEELQALLAENPGSGTGPAAGQYSPVPHTIWAPAKGAGGDGISGTDLYSGAITPESGDTGGRIIFNPGAGGVLPDEDDRTILAVCARDSRRGFTAAMTGETGQAGSCVLSSHFDEKSYCRAVQRVREYIAAGDIFQVNLSQRFSLPRIAGPWPLYRRLREISPAPMAAFLDCGDIQVVSSSMERFLKVTGGRVETRPIKGTRPRGRDAREDARLRDELWHSFKDRAELVMIVDMERNDLGRVCRTGSVHVPELYRLEEYATVFHLVSTVTGELPVDNDTVDLLQAAFPGGSISGAPKIRAMEIIENLEPVRRGIYTGSIGYIGFDGNADLNIVIRTLIFKDGQIHFQVGGGITIDSDPRLEYLETLDKARAMVKALVLAGGGEIPCTEQFV